MSHHGPNPFESEEPKFTTGDRSEMMRKLLDTTGFIGATGQFPEGQITLDDEGAIQFALKPENGKLVIDFGKPVQWVGMTPQEACDLAGSLVKMARAIARKDGETVALVIK
jgi:hypothetical protein